MLPDFTVLYDHDAAESVITMRRNTHSRIRKMLGILGPRKDEVTGETLSEGDQFRHVNTSIDALGGAVLNARNSVSMPLFQSCMNQI